MFRSALAFLIAILLSPLDLAAGRRIAVEDLIALDAPSDPRISPDGNSVVFVLSDYSLETNRANTDLWLVELSSRKVTRLTEEPGTDNQPRWSPDGKLIAFVSDRSGSLQIHTVDPASRQVHKISEINASPANLAWSPDGKWFLFSSDVDWRPETAEPEHLAGTQARVWDDLFYRHWNEWREGRRSHLFLLPASGGQPKDLTPIDNDVPTLALGGAVDLTFTPDSREILFVMNPDPLRAASTNNDIFAVPVEGGEPKNLTAQNRSNDNSPVVSPDGRWLAYRAQMRPGFEADRQHLMLLDRKNGELQDLTPDWQLSVGEIVWAPDSRSIFAQVEEQARDGIYRITVPEGQARKVLKEGHNGSPRITPDGARLLTLRETSNRPDDLFVTDLTTGGSQRLTDINRDLLAQLEMNSVEEFWFTGALSQKVHGLLLRPPSFDASRKYPLVYLIHGGPQSAMQDSFHPRWNYQMFAAAGYVVATVNFHGSSGYGQSFTDSISEHWGDYPYEDLMKGLDYLLATYPFIDGSRLAAAGASYGGYMIFWMGTHTDRFKCLVAHDGVFNAESMYGSTEELWFPEWDFGGAPWESREIYRRWSPHNFSQHLKTPMLVVHGQLDYRIDVSQGLEAYTALRRQNVPARFLYFPDEGHWVLKPCNRRVWWSEVLGWLDKYLK